MVAPLWECPLKWVDCIYVNFISIMQLYWKERNRHNLQAFVMGLDNSSLEEWRPPPHRSALAFLDLCCPWNMQEWGWGDFKIGEIFALQTQGPEFNPQNSHLKFWLLCHVVPIPLLHAKRQIEAGFTGQPASHMWWVLGQWETAPHTHGGGWKGGTEREKREKRDGGRNH